VTTPREGRLALLYRLSQTFNSSLDLDEVLNLVMDEVVAATRAERGFLMLLEADGALGFRVARGIERQTIDAPEFQVSRSVVEGVAREGTPRLTSDAQSDNWLSRRESVIGLRLRSILCVPLQHKEKILGVIYVDNRLQSGIFNEDDLDFLTAIASSAATAIENARLYQLAVEKGRLERELQVAHEVQASLIPLERPQYEGWEFAARWQPARIVSGDFYDFIEIDPVQVAFLVADVADKGMPAALFMALSRSIIRATALSSASPAEAISRANRLISADATNGMFVTLFYAMLDITTGALTFVNAGHNPPLYYRASDASISELRASFMPLGIDETLRYSQETIHLDSGDFILLYTDGVTEALDPEQREFGRERLLQVVRQAHASSAGALLDNLEESIVKFTSSAVLWDDITLVVAKRQPEARHENGA
jgi:phosphoserine phosphatase RsbU/P